MRLAPVFLGSLARRRLATLFSFMAIVLGVALGMAVQAVHEAAIDEFGRGIRSMVGSADLQVIGPRAGFDESLYGVLAGRPEIAEATPMVELELRRPGDVEGLPMLGVEVFSLLRVTPALLPRPMSGADRNALLAEDSIFLSAAASRKLDVKPGESLDLLAGPGTRRFRVLGDLPAVEDSRQLALVDIAAAQTAFGRLGVISRIDLRLAAAVDPAVARRALEALLPPGVHLVEPEAVAGQAGNLSRAYRVNLTMLAAIALLTGGFLVFSAQALAVVRRRTEFAFLRALGLPRRTLFRWLLGEGAVVGLLGGLTGVAVGHALAWGALRLLGGDLGAGYFAGLQPTLTFNLASSALHVGLGILAGVAGAWFPAREAATVAPAQALKAGGEVGLTGGGGHPALGVGLLLAALPACWIPPLGGLPVGGYGAVACLLAGGVLLLPVIASGLVGHLPLQHWVSSRLAAARFAAAPGHAVVAAAGVLTSVALATAMAIMVASFRDSVDDWLTQLMPADLYMRAGPAKGGGFLDEALQFRISAVNGVDRSQFTRHDSLRLAGGQAPVALMARPISTEGSELPLVGRARTAPGPNIWISEAMVDLYGWRPGQRVALPLRGAQLEVHVAGVWRDYARQTGAIMIDLGEYRRLTGDRLVNDAAIHLASGADAGRVSEALLALAPPGVLESARPAEIRAITLRIFDRTFAVTYLLEAVAVVIGLAGVAASFAALAASRRREFGMLRHLGLSRRQIAAMLAIEGSLAAGVGVLGGLLAGGGIGLVLIEVVNRQSFHWSMDLQVPWATLAAFGGGLVALAALAAVLAGQGAMRQDAVLAVREDW